MREAPSRNLREHIERLRRAGDLAEVGVEVDPRLEIAEIHRRVIAAGGPALLFTRVKNSDLPVATNLFGSPRRIEMAFGTMPRALVERAAALPRTLLPPSPSRLWAHRDLVGP